MSWGSPPSTPSNRACPRCWTSMAALPRVPTPSSISELEVDVMKIKITAGRCISSGNCTMQAPDLFDQSDEDGSVILRQSTPPPDLHDAARRAAAACPALAIQIEE